MTSSPPTQPDAFDELAALFMTAPEGETQKDEPNIAVTSELLLVGHLPVRGSIWLTPYANEVARDAGCVAMVRLGRDESSVEVFGNASIPVDALRFASVEQSIRGLAGHVRTWLVRPAHDADESVLLEAGFDRITLLSSADPAAVVAAYQMIKSLQHAAEEVARDLPPIGVAVVGAELAQAQAMVARLRDTAASRLGVSVSMMCCLSRIPVAARPAGFARFSDGDPPDVRDVLRWTEAPRRAQTTETSPVTESRRIAPSESRSRLRLSPQSAQERSRTPIDDTPFSPQRPAPHRMSGSRRSPVSESSWPTWPGAPDPVFQEAASRVEDRTNATAMNESRLKLTPKADPGSDPQEACRNGNPIGLPSRVEPEAPLASHVPGLTLLDVRCPKHEAIEIAIDALGQLHVLGWESDLRALRIVEGWLKSHRELIAWGYPDRFIDAAGRPACHVFTNEPRLVSDLQGTDLKLHVLAPVEVEGKRGWYAAALS